MAEVGWKLNPDKFKWESRNKQTKNKSSCNHRIILHEKLKSRCYFFFNEAASLLQNVGNKQCKGLFYIDRISSPVNFETVEVLVLNLTLIIIPD